MNLAELLMVLSPLILISVGLAVYALIDLFKAERRVKGDNKIIWALIIVLVSTFGPLAYLVAGREES